MPISGLPKGAAPVGPVATADVIYLPSKTYKSRAAIATKDVTGAYRSAASIASLIALEPAPPAQICCQVIRELCSDPGSAFSLSPNSFQILSLLGQIYSPLARVLQHYCSES